MKTFTGRWILVTIATVVGLVVAHAVAWVDIFFWKIGWVAWAISVPEFILLFPAVVIPVAPGGALDTPWFFFPSFVINIAVWSLLFVWIWTRLSNKHSANHTSDGLRQPVDGSPKPSM